MNYQSLFVIISFLYHCYAPPFLYFFYTYHCSFINIFTAHSVRSLNLNSKRIVLMLIFGAVTLVVLFTAYLIYVLFNAEAF